MSLSEAAAVRVVVPVTVEPAPGAVTETVGGVVSHALVVAESVARVEVLPDASYASTPSVCEVLQPMPVNVNVSACVVVTAVPSRNTRYPATPTLSFDAVQDVAIDVAPVLVVVNDPGCVGFCVSPDPPIGVAMSVWISV